MSAPLAARHRRRLAELFPIWEVRNGSRAPELNMPAAIYIDTHGGIGIGGTDDHAGVDVGRTWTEAPAASTPEEYLEHMRCGRVEAHGDQGSAAKWAHAAMALAVRALGRGSSGAPPNPAAVLQMVERVVSQGDARSGPMAGDLCPDDARALLRAWLDSIDMGMTDAELLEWLQSDGFSHADLVRRARRWHERKLQGRGGAGDRRAGRHSARRCCRCSRPACRSCRTRRRPPSSGARSTSCRRATASRSAWRWWPTRVGGMHGVTHTLDEIRERGVAGFEVDVIGTDMNVDRRLSAVAEVDIPFYAGLKIGVPSPLAVVEALAEGRYGLIHVCSPGPAGAAAALTAHVLELPLVGSYHTELAAYAGLRSGDRALELGVQAALGAFYEACDVVLSPSGASDSRLVELGVDATRLGRWDRGVDIERFDPGKRDPGRFGDHICVLYAGRLTVEKGVDLLAESFLAARRVDPRLHLVLAGGGPEEPRLRERLGDAATFLGWLSGEELAVTYASADLMLFCSQTDTFGQVLLESQASGLPVVAVGVGGPAELIDSGRSGVLCPPDAEAIGEVVARLAASPAEREELARGGLAAVRDRTWDAALGRLADGWRRALAARGAAAAVRAA